MTYLRHIATQFRLKNGYHVPVHVLASRMAERNQQHTQYAYLRMMCVVVTLVGIDEEKGPQVFKIDPAGSCYGFHACASGSKEQEAVNALEKQHKKKDGKFTTDEAIQNAVGTLQNVISSDFKANEVEVGVATADNPFFRKLTEQEIDFHLNVIADRA